MKKSIVSGMAALLIAGVLAGCGNKAASTNSSSQSSSSQSSQVTNQQSSSSAMSSSAAPVQHVDDKTVGVMVALLADPDWFKDEIGDDMYYGVHGQDGVDGDSGDLNGYSYITANGDPTSYIHYKVNGDTVTYKQWIPGDTVAEGHMQTKTISLARLEKDYYVSQSQKDEVNGYASQLKSEAAYNSSMKANENNDDDDDDE